MKIVTSHVEIEGHTYERLSLWSGQELSDWPANVDLNVVGRSVPRVDAVAKVTGQAEYTDDRHFPGLLECKVLRSPYANARIKRIDTSRAAAHPGVYGVICYRSVPCIQLGNGQPLFDRSVHFVGQPVAAVAAVDADTADEALRLIQVSYDVRPFVADPAKASEPGAPLVQACGNRPARNNPQTYQRGDIVQGRSEADVVVEAHFTTQIAVHQPLEPHCGVCRWSDHDLTVWTSTQYVSGVARGVAEALGLGVDQVQVISDVIGGAFGSKQFAGEDVFIPALLARRAGRPVRLSLDRWAESVATGYRGPTHQMIRIGARRDGSLTFIEHEVLSGIGAYGDQRMEVVGPSQTLYECPNVATSESFAWTNLSPIRPFRGPGYTEGTFALESAMDELARRLEIDPLALRRRNEAVVDQVSHEAYTSKPLDEAYCLGAAAARWGEPKAKPSGPTRRRGRGMASQIWGGGGGPPAYAWIKVNPDGSATVITGSQDIGTGTRTSLAQIAAEELGFKLADVRIAEGNSLYGPYAPASGGSMTVASVGPAVRAAANQARGILLQLAAQELKQPIDTLSLRDGSVHYGLIGERHVPVKRLFNHVAGFSALGQGDRAPNPHDMNIRTFGAQFAEVEVDVETGEVFLIQLIAVHDCGRVISPLQAESQVHGGVIQGIGFALLEDQIVDPQTGVVLTANLENYLIPTIADVPQINSRLLGSIDQLDNSLGVKGLGEPPIIPTAAAIANAVADAIGVRIYDLPITRARILETLNGKKSHAAH